MFTRKSLHTWILIVIVIFIFSTLFLSNSTNIKENFILMILQLASLVLACLSLKISRLYNFLLLFFISIPIVLISTFHGFFIQEIQLIASTMISVFFLILSFAILTQVIKSDHVDIHVLSGMVASFLLIGLSFASFYLSIYRVDNTAFSGINPNQLTPWVDMIYFSFATITTVGWGDIAAINQLARIIAIFQAIIGVLFNAVVISRFATIFWVHRKTKNV